MNSNSITIAYGDGIGPEIMDAVMKIIMKSGAKLNVETIDIGQSQYNKGILTGIPESAWDSILRTKTILKAPITTPQGKGFKSINVTLRRALGLYANVRPCISYSPFVNTLHCSLDVTIIRENEEDLYSGIEYRHSQNVYQSLKFITRAGCEKIIRYAFEYVTKYGRKKLTCMTKDNIMKMTDGLFHKVFDEIAVEYPNIETNHMIIDIGTAKLACRPEIFDTVVTLNLYGDIISDVVAELSGSVGLAGSANIGTQYSMFEAIHGSAPDIAGKNIANPSGLLHGAIQMLVHIGQPQVAQRIHNAWLKTIEEGLHTVDIFNNSVSKAKLSTSDFADAVIDHLGMEPNKLHVVSYIDDINNDNDKTDKNNIANIVTTGNMLDNVTEEKTLVGVDVYLDWKGSEVKNLVEKMQNICSSTILKLQMISIRGLKVWPIGTMMKENSYDDHWCVRFVKEGESKIIKYNDIIELMNKINDHKMEFIKVQSLYKFGDVLGFTIPQG